MPTLPTLSFISSKCLGTSHISHEHNILMRNTLSIFNNKQMTFSTNIYKKKDSKIRHFSPHEYQTSRL